MSMTLLASNVLGSSAASVTFSSIDQSYKTLRLVVSARGDANALAGNCFLQFNSSSTGYSERLLYGTGTSALSANSSTTSIQWTNLFTGSSASATANTFGNGEVLIPNYASTTQSKVISGDSVNENNSSTSQYANQYLDAALWSDTTAITSITLKPSAGTNFVVGSSFYLYGLK